MSAPPDAPPPVRVLLVDDQELIRVGLRGVLRERFGFEGSPIEISVRVREKRRR